MSDMYDKESNSTAAGAPKYLKVIKSITLRTTQNEMPLLLFVRVLEHDLADVSLWQTHFSLVS